MSSIKINELPDTVLHSLQHELAAVSPDGITVKLTIAQIAELANALLVDGAASSYDTLIELMNEIQSNDSELSTLLNFMTSSESRFVPIGSMLMWPSYTPPTGFLLLNGGVVNRADFPNLWSFVSSEPDLLASSDVSRVGIQFGPGDGSTTFSLGNSAGLTPKGYNTGRTIGDYEGDAIRNIVASSTGSIFNSFLNGASNSNLSGAFNMFNNIINASAINNTGSGEDRSFDLDFDASRVVPTASENRVKNFATNIAIKY